MPARKEFGELISLIALDHGIDPIPAHPCRVGMNGEQCIGIGTPDLAQAKAWRDEDGESKVHLLSEKSRAIGIELRRIATNAV
jgi:hypothetical protein